MKLFFLIIIIGVQGLAITFPKTNLSREQMVLHLLNRAAYGPAKGDLVRLQPSGALESWLEKQLNPDSISDNEYDRYVRLHTPDILLNQKEVVHQFDGFEKKNNIAVPRVSVYLQETIDQKIARSILSQKQLEQVLVDFWFNHFTVDLNFPWTVYSYENDAIRKNVLGKFKDLVLASASHPCMLYYLNNWQSSIEGLPSGPYVPSGLNENYARELMELHTGVPTEKYNTKDVRSVAKIFSGWTIRYFGKGEFIYRPTWHDESDVTILNTTFYGKDGFSEGKKFIEFLSKQDDTSLFISQKLCDYFVQDPAPQSCVTQLRDVYKKTDGDLKQMYLTLFTSTEFWDQSSYLQRVKKPTDFAFSAGRLFNAKMSGKKTEDFFNLIRGLGETIYVPPSPKGYSFRNSFWLSPNPTSLRVAESFSFAKELRSSTKLSLSKNLTQVLRSAFDENQTKSIVEKVSQLAKKSKQNDSDAVLALVLSTPEFQRK